MRTHLEFRSGSFPPQPGEAETVNPGRWGKALAEFLRSELSSRGIEAGDPRAEDWGWVVPIVNDEFPLWVGCGNYDEYPDGFLCFVEPSRPKIRKWFRSVDTTGRVEEVAAAIDAALRSRPDVRDLRWWDEHEVRR